MEQQRLLPTFTAVFEQKLQGMKKQIKKELDKPKKERRKAALKGLLKEAKRLQKLIARVKKDHGQKCPHCGKEI